MFLTRYATSFPVAVVHGGSGAERAFLKRCPDEIIRFEDARPAFNEFKATLAKNKDDFVAQHPQRLQKEILVLESYGVMRRGAEQEWEENLDKEIKNIQRWKTELKRWNPKALLRLPLHLVLRSNVRRNKKRIDDTFLHQCVQQQNKISELTTSPEKIFEREHRGLHGKIDRLEHALQSPDYPGADGELQILQKLRKLDDRYHVLCDVVVSLNGYTKYRDKVNLHSAQVDFIVVGPTGVFVIEVKNWGDRYAKDHDGLTPHEQVDRAGVALYKYLGGRQAHLPFIMRLLVPLRNNLSYDPYYKHVLIQHPETIQSFIARRQESLEPGKIRALVSRLKPCIR